MQEAVQGRLWQRVQPHLEPWLAANGCQHPVETAKQMDAHFQSYESHLFLKMPGMKAKWSDKLKAAFKDIDRACKIDDYVAFTLDGTTFSGHSSKTTVGNTMDSILQAFFYIWKAGIPFPWQSDEVKVFASGDDVVILTNKKWEQAIKESIRKYACSQKTWPTPYGLGQVIKEVESGPIEDMSFLSKTFHYNGGQLFAHVDYEKMFSTKEFYMGSNREMHTFPWAYMELKRLQYGQASEKMDTLLAIARDFHVPKEIPPERMQACLDREQRQQDARFYGDMGGDDPYVDMITGISFNTLYGVATHRTRRTAHGGLRVLRASDPVYK